MNLRHWLIVSIGVFILGVPSTCLAIGSTNYKIQEDFIGGGGSVNTNSANFKSQDSIGATGVGGAAGAAFATKNGAITTSDPALTFSVDTASVNLGSLSTSLSRTGTATFSVSNYTSYGYIVQTLGNPPNNGAHTLAGMNVASASAAGTEQFGINLVVNTVPIPYGAAPQQIPDSTFGFGTAASGYNTANTYKYVSGNTIASAPKSSGKTTYTISYIANISNNTQGGSYSGKQTLVCTGTY